jgi:hypothetical protein
MYPSTHAPALWISDQSDRYRKWESWQSRPQDKERLSQTLSLAKAPDFSAPDLRNSSGTVNTTATANLSDQYKSKTMQTTISPYTQEPYCSRTLCSPEQLSATIAISQEAHVSWRDKSVDDRIEICTRWLKLLESTIPEVTQELALQMGR